MLTIRERERGEGRQQLMVEYGVGLSTIYDIKSQMKKLRDYMKATDTPKAARDCHTLQYHCGEMMDSVIRAYVMTRCVSVVGW